MKQFFKKVVNTLYDIFCAILGLFVVIFLVFKGVFTLLGIFIRNNKTARAIVFFFIRMLEIIYMPIYCIFYGLSVLFRFLTCVCYLFMLKPMRVKQALKTLFL